MSILYNKANRGVYDDITYIMQNTNKGTKRKSKEEMQALADEFNRQRGDNLLDLKTRAVVWPEGKEFNRQHLDATDNVVSIGDRAAQEDFFTKAFPRQSRALVDWRNESGVGKSKQMHTLSGHDYPGQIAAVDNTSAQNFYNQLGEHNTLTPTQHLAYLLGHESGHNWLTSFRDDGHTTRGLMADGDVGNFNMQGGMTIDELLSPEENQLYRSAVIKNRQQGDENRDAVDNYDRNKAEYDEEQRLLKEKKARLASIPEFKVSYNQPSTASYTPQVFTDTP